MRLFVVGATGGSGRAVVKEALGRGWHVTAFVRSPDKLAAHPNLAIVTGDVTSREALAAALPGHDAVIATLGQQRGTPADLMRRAADALALAMADAGVKRIVALSGSGVKFPGDGPAPWMEKLAVPLIRLVLPQLVEDTRGYADRIAASGLDWTLARPMRLTDGPGGKPVRAAATMAYGLGDRIDRADVARFLVDQVESPEWVGKTPMITEG